MGQATSHDEFEWKHDLEPHRTRRTMILKKYPEIKKLFVIDPWFKWQVFGLVVFQFASVVLFRELPWWAVMVLAYVLGGTINHSLMLAIHEISHMHAFGYSHPNLNRWFGLFANLPIGIPMACSFKKYHLIHHKFLGQDEIDTDLPTEWEGRVFRSSFMKAVWLFFQPLAYGLRPFFVYPLPPAELELVNFVIQIAFDVLVYKYLGIKMLVYFVVGSLMSTGLHPLAGHFITEHFLWPRFEKKRQAGAEAEAAESAPDSGAEDESVKRLEALRKLQSAEGNETFSYYGPLNLICWNVGYHVAHHDFPSVPASLLPEVQRIAPEWYDKVPSHSSWAWAMIEFIMDPNLGPFCRIKRNAAESAALLAKSPLGDEPM